MGESGNSGGHSNGHQNGSQGGQRSADAQRRMGSFYVEALANTERPARMVGLFSARPLTTADLERLVEVCLGAMRDEDATASLVLVPLGSPSPAQLAEQRGWRLTAAASSAAAPHDIFVQVFAIDDPQSPHQGLLAHLAQMDEEMGKATRESIAPAKTYLAMSSGKLDDRERIHPFENVVALFSSALHALIVDPAAAMVTMDAGEWADAMEMSLEIESGMKLLRR